MTRRCVFPSEFSHWEDTGWTCTAEWKILGRNRKYSPSEVHTSVGCPINVLVLPAWVSACMQWDGFQLNVASLLAHYSFCFQNNSRGLMERLCWFKGITGLLRQNQHIICFTGTARLSATPLTVPTNTTQHSGDRSERHHRRMRGAVWTKGEMIEKKGETIQGKGKEVRWRHWTVGEGY